MSLRVDFKIIFDQSNANTGLAITSPHSPRGRGAGMGRMNVSGRRSMNRLGQPLLLPDDIRLYTFRCRQRHSAGGNLMAQDSTIEWTEATWNPVTGCTKISPGCKFCYAERMAKRLQAMGQERYRDGFRLTLQPDVVEVPLRWKQPRLIFVNSMSDLFHKDVPTEFIQRCFAVMQQARQHTFQILTKRPERVAEIAAELPWPENVWMGTSVETADFTWRVHELQNVPASTRFLSVEPLLGPIPRLPLAGIHWVIVGGESGPGARPMREEWVIQIRNRCQKFAVPFFFKQWGGVQKSRTGRLLEGRTFDAMPDRSVSWMPGRKSGRS